MGPGAADEDHRGLALGPGPDLVPRRLDLRHLLGDDLLDPVDQLLVAEVLGDLAQRLGGGLGADEVHLDPGDAVLRLQHVGHVVDRAVAHDAVQVGLVGRGELVVGRVAGKGGDIGDPALLEDPVDLEAVAADVVLAQQVDLELVGLVGHPILPTTWLKTWLLAIW